jgi:hypothetical protein
MALFRRKIAVIAVVAIVATAALLACFVLIPKSPGSVTLKGIEVAITYLPGSSGSIGPANNDTCQNCPLTLRGGTQALIQVFWSVVPNGSTARLNGTLSSVVPFYPAEWGGNSPPTLNSEHLRNWSISAGAGFGVWIVLVVPVNPSGSQTAFWIKLNMTAILSPPG